MPIVFFFTALFGRGLLLNGASGIFYALQRTVAEAVLSLMVLEESFGTTPELDTTVMRDSEQQQGDIETRFPLSTTN